MGCNIQAHAPTPMHVRVQIHPRSSMSGKLEKDAPTPPLLPHTHKYAQKTQTLLEMGIRCRWGGGEDMGVMTIIIEKF